MPGNYVHPAVVQQQRLSLVWARTFICLSSIL